MTKVSICIPTYNGARYLEACLHSLLCQTYTDIEILAVDDGSTDNTFEILERYASRDQRIRLVRNDRNLGLVGNWNRCIELAHGQWIKFIFQDDLLEPACVEKMLEFGERTGCPLVACRRDFIFEDVPHSTHDVYQRYASDISMDAAMNGRIHLTPEQFCDAILKFGASQNFIGEPSSTLIKRDILQRFGGFNPDMIQLCDLELWLRVGVIHGIAYVPETLAHFRVHPSSTSLNNATNRQYLMDVIDPLLLSRDVAVSPNFRSLRDRASKNGVDLVGKYYETLTAEIFRIQMGITARSSQINWDQVKLDALLSMYASTPIPFSVRARLGKKLAKMKIERLIDRHITWRFRKT